MNKKDIIQFFNTLPNYNSQEFSLKNNTRNFNKFNRCRNLSKFIEGNS